MAGGIDRLWKMLGGLPLVGGPIRRRAWYPYRHRWVLHFGPRENVRFTQFVRLPTQYDALAGPVVDFLRGPGDARPLRILIFGCSNGAEPWSIASTLARHRPEVDFRIEATDIDETMISKALTGRYSDDEVTRNAFVTEDFVDATFVRDGDHLVVRPELRAKVAFRVVDVLDARAIAETPRADIVVAQNFLYHLYRREARKAFAHLCSRLGPKAVLFVDGMDTDMRPALTGKAGLRPLDYRIAEIHADAMALRGDPWPWTYWALEPFDGTRKDWKQRYATIFLRGDAATRAQA